MTSDHELKQFLVVRNFNPRASAFGVTSRVSLWFSVARCFAADSSCVTHSRNRFCVLADLWLRFELRVTQSHNFFFAFWFLQFSRREPSGFCLEVFCRRTFFNPGKRHISASSEGRIGPNSRVGAPPLSSRLRGPPRNRKSSGKVFLRCCYTISKATTTA